MSLFTNIAPVYEFYYRDSDVSFSLSCVDPMDGSTWSGVCPDALRNVRDELFAKAGL